MRGGRKVLGFVVSPHDIGRIPGHEQPCCRLRVCIQRPPSRGCRAQEDEDGCGNLSGCPHTSAYERGRLRCSRKNVLQNGGMGIRLEDEKGGHACLWQCSESTNGQSLPGTVARSRGPRSGPTCKPVPHRTRLPAGSRYFIRPRRASGDANTCFFREWQTRCHSLASLSQCTFAWNCCLSGPTRTPPMTGFDHPQLAESVLAIFSTSKQVTQNDNMTN
ncbi:hypothetical protein LZ30DRAFT_27853 [Colletotrichum cereale]|nr:hypothetical protein LZ30DRAFT_27853 [Colletotrichum cereale]